MVAEWRFRVAGKGMKEVEMSEGMSEWEYDKEHGKGEEVDDMSMRNEQWARI